MNRWVDQLKGSQLGRQMAKKMMMMIIIIKTPIVY